jgi:hypothetical protein
MKRLHGTRTCHQQHRQRPAQKTGSVSASQAPGSLPCFYVEDQPPPKVCQQHNMGQMDRRARGSPEATTPKPGAAMHPSRARLQNQHMFLRSGTNRSTSIAPLKLCKHHIGSLQVRRQSTTYRPRPGVRGTCLQRLARPITFQYDDGSVQGQPTMR